MPRGSRGSTETAISIPVSSPDRAHLAKAIDYAARRMQARPDENYSGPSPADLMLAEYLIDWAGQIREQPTNGHGEFSGQ